MRSRYNFILKNSTALTRFAINKNRTVMKLIGDKVDGQGRTVGVKSTVLLNCPEIPEDLLRDLQLHGVKFITRHFSSDALDEVKEGSFLLGTVVLYKATEKNLAGRFGDTSESIQRDIFKSIDDTYSIDIGEHAGIYNVGIEGADDPLVIEYKSNTYCCCSSIGNFDLARAIKIRENGNPDINAYVVYDLDKLMQALQITTSKRNDLNISCIMSRPVHYAQKDRRIEVLGHIDTRKEHKRIEKWLSLIFMKPGVFSHEEEIRIVAFDRTKPGSLPDDASRVFLKDRTIAECIVSTGHF